MKVKCQVCVITERWSEYLRLKKKKRKKKERLYGPNFVDKRQVKIAHGHVIDWAQRSSPIICVSKKVLHLVGLNNWNSIFPYHHIFKVQMKLIFLTALQLKLAYT